VQAFLGAIGDGFCVVMELAVPLANGKFAEFMRWVNSLNRRKTAVQRTPLLHIPKGHDPIAALNLRVSRFRTRLLQPILFER
jgi:hypothetical protein